MSSSSSSSHGSSMKKPLLSAQQQDADYDDIRKTIAIHVVQVLQQDDYDEETSSSSVSSRITILLIGFASGVLIQLSTLGANFLLMAVLGTDYINSNNDLILFSFIWSVLTSIMAIMFLGFIRTNMELSHYHNNNNIENNYKQLHEQENELADGDDDNDMYLQNMVLYTEYRFVVGTLIGVFVAWIVTDMALGLQAEVYYSMITLAIALSICRVTLQCFTAANNSDNKKTTTSSDIIVMV